MTALLRVDILLRHNATAGTRKNKNHGADQDEQKQRTDDEEQVFSIHVDLQQNFWVWFKNYGRAAGILRVFATGVKLLDELMVNCLRVALQAVVKRQVSAKSTSQAQLVADKRGASIHLKAPIEIVSVQTRIVAFHRPTTSSALSGKRSS